MTKSYRIRLSEISKYIERHLCESDIGKTPLADHCEYGLSMIIKVDKTGVNLIDPTILELSSKPEKFHYKNEEI